MALRCPPLPLVPSNIMVTIACRLHLRYASHLASCLIIPCISHVTICYIHVRFISTTIHVTSYCGSFTTDLKNKNHVGCIDSGANVDSHHHLLNRMGDIHVSDYMSSHGLYFIMCDIILFTCPAIKTADVSPHAGSMTSTAYSCPPHPAGDHACNRVALIITISCLKSEY